MALAYFLGIQQYSLGSTAGIIRNIRKSISQVRFLRTGNVSSERKKGFCQTCSNKTMEAASVDFLNEKKSGIEISFHNSCALMIKNAARLIWPYDPVTCFCAR
jgi:hypothetical protein